MFRILVGLAITTCLGAASFDQPVVATPGENKARVGTYHVQSAIPGCSYDVNAKHWDRAKPTGVHVYFPGMGSTTDRNETWWPFEDNTLAPLNLIGINMAFADGDPQKDTANKIQAARLAVAQVVADYGAIPGRGIVSGFAEGGFVPGQWLQLAKGPGPAFPFSHVASMQADYRPPPGDSSRLSWFVSLPIRDWNHKGASVTARALLQQLAQLGRKSGGLDVLFWVTDAKRGLVKDEFAASAEVFARSEIALGPVVDPARFSARAAQPAVAAANARSLGAALAAIDRALADAKTGEPDRAQLGELRDAIAARIDELLALVDRLADADPALAAYYARLGQAQLGKHERAKDFAERLARIAHREDFARATSAQASFADLLPQLIATEAILSPSAKEQLAKIAAAAPSGSQTARMARALGQLPTK